MIDPPRPRAIELDGWKRTVFDAVLLAVFTAALIWPLFKISYQTNWGSIESTFLAQGRMLAERWPPASWQPYWYGGTRASYLYPPAVPYATAALSRALPILPARAYRMYMAFCYCWGTAGVYLLVRAWGRSRRAAWAAAGASALLSPVYLFFPLYRNDAPLHIPQKLHVLNFYGEGPHIAALSLVPFALAAAIPALRDGRRRWIAAAALASAAVVSHNFYGAVALGILGGLLTWSLWIAHGGRRVWLRAAALAGLAYGLTAFWLTPSYLTLTAANLRLVADPPDARARAAAALCLAAFAAVTWKWARGRPERAGAVFASGAALVFSGMVAARYYLDARIVGEPHRFVPEMDLALILIAAEILCALPWSGTALGIAVTAFIPSAEYLARPWSVFHSDGGYQSRIEYRLSEWLATHMPGSRVLLTGSLRFWSGVWFDIPQISGGSDQGILNPRVFDATYQIRNSPDGEWSVDWLRALGADAIAVHGPQSREHYHDIVHVEKFRGLLTPLYDDGEDNTIYRVPRRFPGLARVVDTDRHLALPPISPEHHERERVHAYAAAVETGPASAAVQIWEGPDRIRVRAQLAAGQSIAVLASYDPAWRAVSGEQRLDVRPDAMGFLHILAPPGTHDLLLSFETPFEYRAGGALSIGCAAAALALAWRSKSAKIAA